MQLLTLVSVSSDAQLPITWLQPLADAQLMIGSASRRQHRHCFVPIRVTAIDHPASLKRLCNVTTACNRTQGRWARVYLSSRKPPSATCIRTFIANLKKNLEKRVLGAAL